MLGELDTYTLMSFMPMEPEVYERLFVRYNQAIWPTQPLALMVGLTALLAGWRGWGALAGVLLGACWVWVGWSFQLRLYAELNWAASYAGWAFMAQGVLLGLWGLTGRLATRPRERPAMAWWTGIAIIGYAVALHPLLGPLTGRPWQGVELLGSMPDPTALATLGLLLITRPSLLAALVPMLWCLYSAATWWAMGWPPGVLPAAASVIYLFALIGARRAALTTP